MKQKKKQKNNELVTAIKNRLSNLKDRIKTCLKMKKIEQPDKILKIVEEVLGFNKENSRTTGFGVKNTNIKSNS